MQRLGWLAIAATAGRSLEVHDFMSHFHSVIRRFRFLALLSLPLFGCGSGSTPVVETPPPPVTVSQPIVRDLVDEDDYEGRIVATQKVDVRARVRGHLIKINFHAGDMVKPNDLLYEIDPRPYQTTLDAAKAQQKSAEAALEYAKAEYNRTNYLIKSGAASRTELDVWTAKQAVAKGDVLKAQAAVAQAQLDLDYTKITSPCAGQISRSQLSEGNLVNAGGGETLLTTIVTIDPIYVYFDVDERSLLRYRGDQRKHPKGEGGQTPFKDLHIPVYVGLEGEQGYPHHGVLDFTDNRVNPSTGTMQVRGVLENKKGLLQDGMRARVRVPVGDKQKLLLVTELAIGTDQGRKFVYVVNDQNVAERREVQLGKVRDGLQIVRDGIKPEDWVVVNGIQRVRDGAKVEPKKSSMPGADMEATKQDDAKKQDSKD